MLPFTTCVALDKPLSPEPSCLLCGGVMGVEPGGEQKNACYSKSSAWAAIITIMSAFGDRLKRTSKVRFSLHPDTLTWETFKGLDALCPSLRDPCSLGQPNQVVQTKALKGLLQKGKSPFCFMNMVLEISLYQNSHSFIWETVTHFISLIPLSAPKCMLSSHLQRRKALRPKGLLGGAKWVVPQAPQHSPRLEAQIPVVKAEGSHIMPGNKPAAAAGQPEAPFRSFILLGRSLFLGGGRRGHRLWLKGNLRLTQLVLSLIQTKQEVPSLVPDSVLEGQMGGLEEQARRDHPQLTLGVSFLLQLALDA